MRIHIYQRERKSNKGILLRRFRHLDCFLGKGGRLCLKPKVRRIQAIIKDYASIISTDGNVNDNELKEWLLLDDEIENKSTKNIEAD